MNKIWLNKCMYMRNAFKIQISGQYIDARMRLIGSSVFILRFL